MAADFPIDPSSRARVSAQPDRPGAQPGDDGQRALAELLKPGAVVSGRVVEGLGHDQYLIALRGRTLIAESHLPLATDSVVRMQVVATGTQLSLRLLDGKNADRLVTADPTARARSLGLPPGPATDLLLAAFEGAGAPLSRDRLQTALAAVAAALALTPPSTNASASPALGNPPVGLPAALTAELAATPAELANAFARVARSGLPATPATLALALRAGAGALPNPAGALQALHVAIEEERPIAGAIPLPAIPLAPKSPLTSPAHQTVPTQPVPAGGKGAPLAGAPLPPGIPGTSLSAQTVGTAADETGPLAPSTILTPPASRISPGVGATVSVPAAVSSSPAASVLAHAPSTPPTGAGAAAGPQVAADPRPAIAIPVAPTTTQVPLAPSSAPIASTPQAPTGVTTAKVDASAAAPGAPLAAPTPSAQSTGPATAMPTTATAPRAPELPALRVLGSAAALIDLSALRVPDPVREGALAVQQALTLAGVRSAGGDVAGPTPLLRRLAGAVSTSPAADAVPATGRDSAAAPAAPAQSNEALVRVAREQAADTVFKPDDLADYRLVLSLPLQADGQPTPARFAIAERPGVMGTTTYLRVDAELSDLGAVSVRLSGIEGGALAISLVSANGLAGRTLADGLPDLAASLHELGIVAGLRVVDGGAG